MSNLAQFFASGLPIGQVALMPNSPISLVQNGQEFLRVGSVKSYAADYASSLSLAPHLRVFGTPASSYGTATTGTAGTHYGYVGTNYIASNASGSTMFYASSLANLSASASTATGVGGTTISKSPLLGGNARLAQGNGFVVIPTAVNTAHVSTTDGATYNSVAGTFTSSLVPNAGAYCGSLGWIFLQSLAGSGAGTRSYIANTNPTGSWSTDAGTNIGMSVCNSIASNGTVIVAVGVSASATAGKIATATSVSGAFTDRTSASGISFSASEAVIKVVWTGSRFVALTDTSRIFTSTDGINWSQTDIAFDVNQTSPVGNGSQPLYTNGDMATDGAGKVVMVDHATTPAGAHPLLRVSTDHGLTFTNAQLFLGKHAQTGTSGCRTVSYANGRFIVNLSGAQNNFVDAGSIATPDYMGQQIQFAQGFSVRIK